MILDTEHSINKGMTNGEVSLEVNQPGSFSFSILRDYENIDKIKKHNSIVAIQMKYINDRGEVRDDYWIFIGQIVSVDIDLTGNISCQAEGALALLKNILREYTYSQIGNLNYNNAFLESEINYYNATIDGNKHYGGDYYSFRFEFDCDYNTLSIGDPGGYIDISSKEMTDNSSFTKELLDAFKEIVVNRVSGFIDVVYRMRNEDTNRESTEYSSGCTFIVDALFYKSFDLSDIASYILPNHIYCHNVSPYRSAESGLHPSYHGYTGINPTYLPTFSFDRNISNVEKKPIKNEIWSCIYGTCKVKQEGNDEETLITHFKPIERLIQEYGIIYKHVEFSDAENLSDLENLVDRYVNMFAPIDVFKLNNYYVDGIEPCLVGNVLDEDDSRVLLRIGRNVNLKVEKDSSGNYRDMIATTIGISHDLFSPDKSKYIFGFDISDSIMNEDLSSLTQ